MSEAVRNRLRVAAIDFLNPAPLLYSFEHRPERERLAQRYDVHYTTPAQCAEQLRAGGADLGLVPIGAMPFLPDVAAVPGCAIASPGPVRSIQLVLRPDVRLEDIRGIAADAASRSSAIYVQILSRSFCANAPEMQTMPADLPTMLQQHDAALLIGDPALLALEERNRTGAFAEYTWIDVASWWRDCTGLPWVAAVWAVRKDALHAAEFSAAVLMQDLNASRDAGLAHVPDIVAEWEDRIDVSPEVIHTYLTENIHYMLDEPCLEAIVRFFELARQTGLLPPYTLPLLT